MVEVLHKECTSPTLRKYIIQVSYASCLEGYDQQEIKREKNLIVEKNSNKHLYKIDSNPKINSIIYHIQISGKHNSKTYKISII